MPSGTLDIIHVDMDAFFASVEQRDRPELRGKPVVIGGPPDGRGVVSTASYEAREFGVHSAMASAEAAARCPQAIFVTPDHHKYSEVSRQLRDIFFDFTDRVEPLSVDEAFLDVSGKGGGIAIASDIKRRIREELELTASVGVSYNKFLAVAAPDASFPDFPSASSGELAPRQSRCFTHWAPTRQVTSYASTPVFSGGGWDPGPVSSSSWQEV